MLSIGVRRPHLRGAQQRPRGARRVRVVCPAEAFRARPAGDVSHFGGGLNSRLLVLLGVENVELVVGAATVLFAPDVVRLNRRFSRGCRDHSARNSLYRPHHPFCLFSWFFYQLDRSDAPPALFISFGGFSSSI